MAAFIHCDICRVVVALDECEPGAARLVAMADIASKMYEAMRWYFHIGSGKLREIARTKSCGESYVDKNLRELKARHPISGVDRYLDFRNKVGYHYNAEMPRLLTQFGKEDSEAFYRILINIVRYACGWTELARAVIQDGAADG